MPSDFIDWYGNVSRLVRTISDPHVSVPVPIGYKHLTDGTIWNGDVWVQDPFNVWFCAPHTKRIGLPNPDGSSTIWNGEVYVPIPIGQPLLNIDDGTWGELKPQTPWGTLPTLLLPSGEVIGQQRAILRFLGKLIKYEGNYLYPEEPEASARVDGLMDMIMMGMIH